MHKQIAKAEMHANNADDTRQRRMDDMQRKD